MTGASGALLGQLFASETTRFADLRGVVAEALSNVGADDIDFETERLVALIDGLTFELVHPHGIEDFQRARDILRGHIGTVVK